MVDFALIRDPGTGRWLRFRRPVEVVSAVSINEVLPVLARIDEAVEKRGLVAAGYVAYEAAPAFDRAFRVHPPVHGMPLLSFGLFEDPTEEGEPLFKDLGSYSVGKKKVPGTEFRDGRTWSGSIPKRIRVRSRMTSPPSIVDLRREVHWNRKDAEAAKLPRSHLVDPSQHLRRISASRIRRSPGQYCGASRYLGALRAFAVPIFAPATSSHAVLR